MKRLTLPLVCLALISMVVGCPPGDETGAPDADADGYTTDEDCDDEDASVYPGAPEECNGVDDDCDEDIDEFVALTWYADTDGDGFGDEFSTTSACEQPTGYVDDDTDCDDENGDVYPDAAETCNGLDDDCDGEWDEDAGDASSWYVDDDGDGFGDPDSAVVECEQPHGYIEDGQDCDDSDYAINPDADEVCDDVDNDCDGDVDEDDAIDPATWYLDTDSDTFGESDKTTQACDMPSGYAAVGGDCDDSSADIYPGADEYCDEIDQDCDGVVDDDDSVDAPFWYGDTDGDGFGSPDTEVQQCYESGDLVSDDTDCDDENADVNPDANEVCDEVDNDCDGDTDEDDAVDASTWYLDDDSDDWGDEASSAIACDQPSGYAAESGDCDDTDDAINPGAIQFCGDGVDNDCSGDDPDCPVEGDLLITEIMKDPANLGDSSGEWFEVYNASSNSIDLQGLMVSDDGGGETWLIDEALDLEVGGFAVMARDTAATTAYDLIWSGFQLVNTEDEVILSTYGTDGTDGTVIHSVYYDDTDWPDLAGASLSLDPDAFDTTSGADPANWCAGQSVYDTGDLGTPGADNDDCP